MRKQNGRTGVGNTRHHIDIGNVRYIGGVFQTFKWVTRNQFRNLTLICLFTSDNDNVAEAIGMLK